MLIIKNTVFIMLLAIVPSPSEKGVLHIQLWHAKI